ncbi:hypothetical protein OG579_16880 [Williamsia herbipolensis]|uniref:Uncharacterized protein n=1 Tax=Williamsia herbipolensis TaxID=1603258 RepID=A0AAU4JZX8_9NOCA|nr:hypothetical protein [Williamsia herbipolensis]
MTELHQRELITAARLHAAAQLIRDVNTALSASDLNIGRTPDELDALAVNVSGQPTPPVEFVDDPPPPKLRGRGAKHQAFADELRAHPDRWARLPWLPANHPTARALANRIRRGEFIAYRGSDGVFDAYARDGAVLVRFRPNPIDDRPLRLVPATPTTPKEK